MIRENSIDLYKAGIDGIERSVLSSIINSDEAFSIAHSIINRHDFSLPAYGDIFEAICACVDNDEPIEVAFIKKRLGKKFNENVLADILVTGPIVDVETYANEIKEHSIKRALMDVSVKIPKIVDNSSNLKNAIDEISSEIYALLEDRVGGAIKESKEVIRDVLLDIELQKTRDDKDLVGLDTGFRYLNEHTKGFKPGELIIIAARPGMGKTAFALNLTLKTIKQEKGVVFFSLEMPAKDLMKRVLSSHTGIPLSNIMTAKMQDSEYTRFGDACDELSDKKLFIYDSGYVNIHQIRTQMRKLKSKNEDISLCVIDYIGLMTSSSKYSERHLEIAEISRGLKLLARELNIPIIALSQLNRGVESRANKRPMLSDLRESGAIEQDADTILFVYRGDVYAEQEEMERRERYRNEGKDMSEYKPHVPLNKDMEEAEIIIGKNRNGPLGTVKVVYKKEITKFADALLEQSSEPLGEFSMDDGEENYERNLRGLEG
ncbi:replicative DNA helicase [uncultured Campylobacter sp.]|uniref:replicative DNA helicase n=1 Tax=uncultured Campylobacter sp. TaxID=218934 RepID=UPI00260E1FA2|nr:replicative DNA helicase [uncultured Campylobacter sp.]